MTRSVDKELIRLLSKRGPASTYEIAKMLGISWSTANMHLYRLKAEGKVKRRTEMPRIGMRKKVVWWI